MGISSDSWPAREQVHLDVDKVLPHSSINPEAKVTVVLIHGACVDRNDWDMVIPYLHDYHLLVPDQICHGEARHIQPYTTAYAAKTIAQLIQQQGHDGLAHVVGHSLGASVALRLAAEYPEVVTSMIVSGVGRLPRNGFTPYLPYAVWLNQRIERSMPRSVTRWLMDGTDVRFGDISMCTLDFNKEVFSGSLSEEQWPQFEARALVIAATKKGILPTNDNVQVARDVAEAGRKLNRETFAVQHKAMRHPWNRQDPRLFAEVLRTWVEEKGMLPSGFERL
ncbi:hypothetical protein CKM354_000725900 [Cercospora kikuchii]|uniref:AB hydrolase-1 domain-containing protein n=1 Tax=Cercospora kikuchii TaxID=84275 RepID=A0A9P3CQS4_9PEZI|nr:uncharacterized protein CKM354_000725900 [Cercospora kikuchii]GIZ44050.1 hypothetical protein CKM354_000725900 [Cercospora kikuchii]